jgi:hypothetical protein
VLSEISRGADHPNHVRASVAASAVTKMMRTHHTHPPHASLFCPQRAVNVTKNKTFT